MKRAALAGAVCAALALCIVGAGVHPTFDARALGAFVRGVFPPDLSPPFLRVVGLAIARSASCAPCPTWSGRSSSWSASGSDRCRVRSRWE